MAAFGWNGWLLTLVVFPNLGCYYYQVLPKPSHCPPQPYPNLTDRHGLVSYRQTVWVEHCFVIERWPCDLPHQTPATPSQTLVGVGLPHSLPHPTHHHLTHPSWVGRHPIATYTDWDPTGGNPDRQTPNRHLFDIVDLPHAYHCRIVRCSFFFPCFWKRNLIQTVVSPVIRGWCLSSLNHNQMNRF